MTDPLYQPGRSWTTTLAATSCAATPDAARKANPTVTDNVTVCGRCRQGRGCLNDAMTDAINNYNGPGLFLHTYWEGIPLWSRRLRHLLLAARSPPKGKRPSGAHLR